MHGNLKAARRRANRSGSFWTNFILRMRRNCYFRAFGQILTSVLDLAIPAIPWFGHETTFLHVFHRTHWLSVTVLLPVRFACCASYWDDFHQLWTQSTCLFLTYNVLLLIRYVTATVSMTFNPFILNVCSVSAVTWSNSIPNLSEIEQSAAELLRF